MTKKYQKIFLFILYILSFINYSISQEKRYFKCKNGYELVGNSDTTNLICLEKSLVNIGYYRSKEYIYYACLPNCDTCSNDQICEKCSRGYTYINNKCIKLVENCKEYNENGICYKCNDNFGFNKEDRNECTNIENFNTYYTKDKGISYYPSNEKIKNCKNCFYDERNKSINCYLCKENFILVNNENKCYPKEDINKNKKYFLMNETHSKKCSDEIDNCDESENSEKCIKCTNNYFMINNNKKKCWRKDEIQSIEEYYLNNNNTTYYSCNNPIYNSITKLQKMFIQRFLQLLHG